MESRGDHFSKADLAGEAVLRTMDGQSDRAVALIGAAFLEESLAAMLERVFVKELAKKALERSGVHGFAARTNVAYALGLLDRDAYDDLNLVRLIRNAFAHTYDPIGFDDLNADSSCVKLTGHRIVAAVAPASELLARCAFICTVGLRAKQFLVLADSRDRLQVDPFWDSEAKEMTDYLRAYLVEASQGEQQREQIHCAEHDHQDDDDEFPRA